MSGPIRASLERFASQDRTTLVSHCLVLEAEIKRLLAALDEIVWIVDDEADCDDGSPNTAMRVLVAARNAIAEQPLTGGEHGA